MKKKLKGLLSLWLAAVLVLGTPTVPVLAAETNHGGHSSTEWEGCSGVSGNLLSKKYYLSSSGYANSAVVSGNTTICLNGTNLQNYNTRDISVKAGGNLTMDDCQGNGECYAAFNVESGGTLNLKRGNYVSYQESKVEDGGTLNIGDEDGGMTKVMIAYYDGSVLKSKITGNFNLIRPNETIRNNTLTDKVEVFDWYLSSEGGGKNDTISGVAISSIKEASSKYTTLWSIAETQSGIVHLYSKWADGYKVTYNYNDNNVTPAKTEGVVSGNSITIPSKVPSKTGCTFSGWLDGAGKKYNAGESFKPTANTTLTAQWKQNPSPTPTPDPTPSPSPSPDPTPTTPPGNNSNDKDWNSVKNDVANAKDGDTVNIDLSKDTTVPGDIFNSIKGKDVTLVLDLGNGMSWKINGNSITADKLGDINFSVNANSNAIPVEVINKVSGERYTIQISLAHNGPFGFEAILAVELDAKDAGLYANLFYYNPQTKALEFVGADIITEKGMAEFTFTHASDYVIVIDKVSMDPNANIPAKGTKLTDKKTKAVYQITKAGKTGGTVAYVKSTDKKATSISIPATVNIDGITYKVTSIAANAFKNNTTVKKITIGKNVEKIGAKAFYGCKKLKSITIKTTKLISKNVGSDAFKGIANASKIKVPEKKLDTYQKILAKKGLGDQATVKK